MVIGQGELFPGSARMCGRCGRIPNRACQARFRGCGTGNVRPACQAGVMVEMAIEELAAPVVQRLRSAVAAERAAQAAQASAILELAREVDWSTDDEFVMEGPRMIRFGFDGTPLVDESLPLEIAALYGISQVAAVGLIGDVVNLEWRHEALWAAVTDGRLPLWQARKLAQIAVTFTLSGGQCGLIDEKVAPLLGVVGWGRIQARYRAAIVELLPWKVREYHESRQPTRHVSTGVDADDPTLSWMSALADTGDVQAFEQLLGLVTKALIDLGDTDPVEIVRSKALGRMADPEGVLALLDGVDDDTTAGSLTEKRSRRRHSPTAQVFVHLNAEDLENGGVARIERLGPVLVDDLSRVVGHHRVTLTPVVETGGEEPVTDAYEVPDSMRSRLHMRDRFEVFPFSCREARGLDLDHTIPYVAGESGQTRPSNLGPLSRRAHRGKTHGGWGLDQPCPGVFWWTSPHGQVFRVGPDGTTDLTPDGTERLAVLRRGLWEWDCRRDGLAQRLRGPTAAPG